MCFMRCALCVVAHIHVCQRGKSIFIIFQVLMSHQKCERKSKSLFPSRKRLKQIPFTSKITWHIIGYSSHWLLVPDKKLRQPTNFLLIFVRCYSFANLVAHASHSLPIFSADLVPSTLQSEPHPKRLHPVNMELYGVGGFMHQVYAWCQW